MIAADVGETVSQPAAEGSQLTLRAFNDGSEAMKWIEQSRYEA